MHSFILFLDSKQIFKICSQKGMLQYFLVGIEIFIPPQLVLLITHDVNTHAACTNSVEDISFGTWKDFTDCTDDFDP